MHRFVNTAWKWLVAHAEGVVAALAFAAIAAGFWHAWQPLGLIVPGGIVLGLLTLKHLRGTVEPAAPDEERNA